MPALQVSRPDLNGVLRDSGCGTTGGARRHRTRSLLVAGQMALSVVLLIGAGLLIESFRHVQRVKPGFDPQQRAHDAVSLPPARYPDDARRTQFVRETLERHRGAARCAVRGGVAGTSDECRGDGAVPGRRAGGRPVSQRPLAEWKAITPGYFQTMGIPLCADAPSPGATMRARRRG